MILKTLFLLISIFTVFIQDDHVHNELKEKYTNLDLILFLLILLCISLIAYVIYTKYKRKSSHRNQKKTIDILTSKEVQVYNLILEHKTNKEIAALLFISSATVKTHINNIYRKLRIKSRKELILLYKS